MLDNRSLFFLTASKDRHDQSDLQNEDDWRDTEHLLHLNLPSR